MAKTVLLTNTSWWACASRLAMGFADCGYYCSAVYPANGHPLAKTRAVRQSFPYSGFDPLGSLTNAIRTARPDVIVPCDDRAVEHLHLLHAHATASGEREIAGLIERSLGNPASFRVTASRSAFMEIAAEEGIRVPATWPICSLEEVQKANAGTALPWVLKADGSWGGHGVRLVQTAREAERSCADLSKPLGTARLLKRMIVNRDPYWVQTWWHRTKPALIAQAYVKGRPANMAASCWKGELLDGITAEVVQAQGATGSATVVRIVDSPEMLNAARILARRLGLSGFFGLDFMIDEQTGQSYLIEMNPRCTPLSHLALGEGRDPIAAFAARLSGQPPRSRTPVTHEEQIAYFPQAWHWDSKSELLKTSFCDIPIGEPELVQDLLQVPWPDRSLLARLSNQVRGETFQDRHSRGGLFQAALTADKAANEPPGGIPCRSTHR